MIRWLTADVFDGLATLEDGSIDLIVTSPPFDWRPGIVLDPFAGSGTTLAVASGHGHDTIGVDLDARNEELARERVGPLLWQEVSDV